MSKKVVTMGEIMLRLSTPGHERFIQADEFDVFLSEPLSIVALVGRYPANQLIRREAILKR